MTAAALLLLPVGARAQDGVWTNAGSGNWSDTGNWLDGIVANGTNNRAEFGAIDLTVDVTNHLDSPRTIGRLVFGDTDTNTPAGWVLDGGGSDLNILTFTATNITPGITASNRVTISAPITLQGAVCDMEVGQDGVLALASNVVCSTRLEKSGEGVLTITGPYGTSGIKPESIFRLGTVNFISNVVYSDGISTPNAGGDVTIVANNAGINAGGSIRLQTVYSTGVFEIRDGSLTVNWIGLANSGNYGANESIMTISGGAVVNASSGISTGDKADTGGATSFVLNDGTVDAGNSTILIGTRAGENFFTQLGGTVISEEVRLQYRMNVGDWNFASLYNLNSGTSIVARVVTGDDTANFVINTAYFNFHGGTLRTSANEGDFFRTTLTGANAPLAPPHVIVWSEGAVIDTDGHDVTIQQPLVAPSGSGIYADTSSNLTVSLPGTDGGSGYKATPLVRIGLKIYGNTATAIANMTDDGTTNGTLKVESITITNPGMNFTAPKSVTFSGAHPTIEATPPVLVTATNASGGLTKLGAGTLTLSATNTYTGDTIVDGGTLELMHACLADETDLYLARDAHFAIGFDGEDVIHALHYDNIMLPRGRYYSGDLGGMINGSGSGYLNVMTGHGGVQLIIW